MSDQIDVNAIANTLQTKVDLPNGVSQSDIDYVVETQIPTASNNYTWYRLYKSGWVEQGGKTPGTSDSQITVVFPIRYADVPNVQLTRYFQTLDSTAAQNQTTGIGNLSVTGFTCYDIAWPSGFRGIACWEARGIASQS